METPYIFDFESHKVLSGGPVEVLPEWCTYSMAFAQERYHYRLQGIEIVVQRHNDRPFHVDLMQINVTVPEPFPLCLALEGRQLILYFMLEGEFLIATAEGAPIVVTRSNMLLMGYADTGKYLFHAGKGLYVAMVVVILPEWLETRCGKLPAIRDMLDRFRQAEKPYDTLHHLRMERKVRRWLEKIYGFSQTNEGAIDGNLRQYISLIMEYYDGTMGSRTDDLAYRVKAHLDEHYRDSGLSVKSLAEHFSVTERTLLNNFKGQYRMAPYHYITKLRMERARHLTHEKKLPVEEVYREVGYQSEKAFRIAYRKYFKG